jgi:hypothetical protein
MLLKDGLVEQMCVSTLIFRILEHHTGMISVCTMGSAKCKKEYEDIIKKVQKSKVAMAGISLQSIQICLKRNCDYLS